MYLDNTSLHTLQLPSKIDSISILENFIDGLSAEFSFSEELYASVLICLSEAVVNAIVHGNRESLVKKVYVNLEIIAEKEFIFTVYDQGDGFNYANLLDPTAPENLEKLTGRGIFIIKKLADQCVFNSKGNEVELHFKR